MANIHLPILDQPPRPSKPPTDGHDEHEHETLERTSKAPGAGSLGKDGRRLRPYPADVTGKWIRLRRVTYYLLIALWAALPWIPINGNPAVFLDIEKRQFFLFGATFNAQDIWLMFFLVTGFGFGLLYSTTVLGRVWCGWACPQTVFIEGIFRPIERLINGPRNVALRRAKSGLGFDRAWRQVATHALYLVAALFVSHVFVAYFVSIPKLFAMVFHAPSAHPEVFAWMLGTTILFYVSFGLFREQFCVVMCPYGRLQSALLDDDSIVIGYDERRGEPRGKATAKLAKSVLETPAKTKGDCVDCSRCVVVCPTGIDIRDGLQLDCIGCTACIDACDEVMVKLDRPRGLIRYDSLKGLRGEKRRFLRPRVYIYTVLLVAGMVAASIAVGRREPFEANLLRLPGIPYTRDEAGNIRNGFELHIVNKTNTTTHFQITPVQDPASPGSLNYILPMSTVDIEPLGSRRVPFFVTMDEKQFTKERPIIVRIDASHATSSTTSTPAGSAKTVNGRFLGSPHHEAH